MTSRSDKRAFQALLELVRSPRPRNAHVVVEHDWSRWPRVQDVGFAEMDPLDFEAVARRGREFLRDAVTEIDARGGHSPDRLHPLDVFEMHVLEPGATWESIQAYRDEQGLPAVSLRTLRNRQQEAVGYLLEWAATASGVSEETVPGSESDAPDRPRRSRLLVPIAALLVLSAVAIAGLPGFRTRPVLEGAERVHLGRHLCAHDEACTRHTPLQRFVDPRRLPPIDGSYVAATIVEEPAGQFVYLGTGKEGDDHTTVIKWDPRDGDVVWSTELEPPVDERFTHEGVREVDMGSDVYGVRWMAGGAPHRTDDEILVVLWGRYSPNFVHQLDTEHGTESGRYVHAGHVFAPVAHDLDGNGDAEYLLGATDNPDSSAVIIVLDEIEGARAASNVSWNESRAEGALARVLVPEHGPLMRALQHLHWYCFRFQRAEFDRGHSRLVAALGSPGRFEAVGYVQVEMLDGRVVGVGYSFADGQDQLWSEVGMTLEEAERFLERSTRVHGGPDVGDEGTPAVRGGSVSDT